MVDSPEYPCQLVLVMKLSAVLKEESGETLAKPCGFSGSHSCSRCRAYTINAPKVLNSSSPSA